MGIIATVIIIFLLPFIWMLWSSVDVKNGKREKIEWKKPGILFLSLILISVIVNTYFYNFYHLPFFQNSFELMVVFIMAGAFLLFFAIINIIVSIKYKGAPKSFHNPKAIWIFTGVFCFVILFFGTWVFPLGQKASYTYKLDKAIEALSEEETNEEVSVLFMNSEQECLRRQTSSCYNEEYSNYFYVKNNLDEEKEVQVRIRALDANQNELKIVESNIMTLDGGELRLVETEETNDRSNVWSRSSFKTDIRTHYYESMFRFRDVE
ncbi:hypothetical protein JMA_30760 [Jeotgalibacillus malaysiensis]|uniref:Uncharacterized protein n=1 Tax=Jeotgalibacillus malaysiensis TaxID=1508404 RepID=A0A0B5AUX6_9BACL|nr:hypothetical protein [Jeotgalibacillus malaysiensis]AJD92393.1 hypothetical protein JMA_30760 [Jeotgalibacillus malaysiensis]